MCEVRDQWRDEWTASMLAEFGVAARDIGVRVSWGDIVSLTRVAYTDPATRLGAARQGWAYPASVAECSVIALAAGENAERILPGPLGARLQHERVDDQERARAAALLEMYAPTVKGR